MLNSPLPSWKQLLGKVIHNTQETEYWGSENIVYTHSSAASLSLIFSIYKDMTNSDKVDIFVPAYFCEETLNKVRDSYIRYHYYEIEENFEPDWKKMKERKNENVDFFIFCHFFGMPHDINRAKVFCNSKNAILIEDCAHVLYPATAYGKKGDFVIYSPHKVLSVPDGGILIKNKSKNEDVDAIFQGIVERCCISTNNKQLSWRAKKAVQKIIQIQRKVPYIDKAHFGKKEKNIISDINISDYAYSVIRGTSYKEYKKIAYVRRCNLQLMNYLIKRIDHRVTEIVTSNVECPYVAVYSIDKVQNKSKFMKKLSSLGIQAQYWPDLPEEIKSIKGYLVEKDKSRNLIVVPVHQGLKMQKIAKLVKQGMQKSNQFLLEWLDNSERGEKIYNEVIRKIDFCNIPQDWVYGTVKHAVEYWRVERAVVRNNNSMAIGVVQLLKKQKAGITVAVRINRGPLLVSDYDSTENKLAVMELIRKAILHPIPIIYAPDINFTAENLVLITKYKWKQWKPYGFPSGVIDLRKDEDTIRKGLDSKWRNQLVSAEKNMLEIKTDFERFQEILDIYEESQTEKCFKGIPRKILEGILSLEQTPLRLMYLTNKKDEIMAFDIFYVTENFGLYFVGWNSPEGRKNYSNNLLLYNAAVQLKKEGVRWLELGGIDYIDTEENARFKDGMKPKHYQLIGEFIKF